MEAIHLLRIIVASPGDVQAERDALPAVLEALNRESREMLGGIAKVR